MMFQRAIRRELLQTVGAVFTTLFTIVITVMLIRILGDAAVSHLTAARVRIETEPPVTVQADGQVLPRTPAEFSLRRQALAVVIP